MNPGQAGFLGAFIVLGVSAIVGLYEIFRNRPEKPFGSGRGFRPDSNQRNDTWGREDSRPRDKAQRPQGPAVCRLCEKSLARGSLQRLACKCVFHDACITQFFEFVDEKFCPTCRVSA